MPSAQTKPKRLFSLNPVVAGLNALASVWIIALMVLICADVLLRTVANAPIAGVTEMVSFSIVGIVFLQLAHTLRAGALTRSDMLLTVLEDLAPRARQVLLVLFNLVGAGLMVLALVYFLPALVDAWQRPQRNFLGNPGFFQIPKWPLYALMAIGMLATLAQFCAEALNEGRGRLQ